MKNYNSSCVESIRSNLDGLDAVVEAGPLRGKDELVGPQRVHDAGGDQGSFERKIEIICLKT